MTDKQTNEEQITNFLVSRGHVLSPQRRILIAAVCREKEITDVEGFWLQLRSQHGICWATVYNNMNLLVRSGWLLREGEDVQTSVYRLREHRKL